MTSKSCLFKLLWTVVILFVFILGFDKILQAVADYYKFDKITNIERVYPETVTFPAITICTQEGYSREHYRNGSLIMRDRVYPNLLKRFLDLDGSYFYSVKNNSFLEVNNHLDTFKMNECVCLRFNAVKDKSVELIKATSIQDRFRISLKNIYIKNISYNEYYKYSFLDKFFFVYAADNYLNSFENLKCLFLKLDSAVFDIGIEKVSIETKLPEPYNPCKKSSVDEPCHQMNCIESCYYKEIKNKYNCTFHSTLFSIQGFRQCNRNLNYTALKKEFFACCLKECPCESCFTEKFTFDVIKLAQTRSQFYMHGSDSEPPTSDYTYFSFKFLDFSTLNITQIPKTDSFTFLNNIGGGLGLFMAKHSLT